MEQSPSISPFDSDNTSESDSSNSPSPIVNRSGDTTDYFTPSSSERNRATADFFREQEQLLRAIEHRRLFNRRIDRMSTPSLVLDDEKDSMSNFNNNNNNNTVKMTKGTINKFSGTVGSIIKIDQFLTEFEDIMKLNSIDINDIKSDVLAYFKLALTDTARSWMETFSKEKAANYMHLTKFYRTAQRIADTEPLKAEVQVDLENQSLPPELASYAALKASFLKRFKSDTDDNHTLLAIINCKASQFQSIDAYTSQMEKLFNACPTALSSETKYSNYLSNCDLEGYRQHMVAERLPEKTYVALHNRAKAYENGLLMEGSGRRIRERSSLYNNYSNINRTAGPRPFNGTDRRGNVNAIGNGINNVQRDMNQFARVRDQNYSMMDGMKKEISTQAETALTRVMEGQNHFFKELNSTLKTMTNQLQELKVAVTDNRRTSGTNNYRGGGNAGSFSRGNGRRFNPTGGNRGNAKCFICGSVDHLSPNCPNKRSTQNNINTDNDYSELYDNQDDQDDESYDQPEFHQETSNTINEANHDQYYYDDEQKYASQSVSTINIKYPTDAPIVSSSGQINVANSNRSSTQSTPIRAVPAQVKATIDQVLFTAIIDSGAGCSLLSHSAFKQLPNHIQRLLLPPNIKIDPEVSSATGAPMEKLGSIEVPLVLDRTIIKPIRFVVARDLVNDILIGNDALCNEQHFGPIDIANGRLLYKGNGKREFVQLVTRLVSKPKTGIPTPTNGKELLSLPNDGDIIGTLLVIGNHTIPAQGELVLGGNQSNTTRVKGLGYFRDSYIKNQRHLLRSKYQPPSLLVERNPNFNSSISVINSVCVADDGLLNGQRSIPLHLFNRTNQSIRIKDGTKIGNVHLVQSKSSPAILNNGNINAIMSKKILHQMKSLEHQRQLSLTESSIRSSIAGLNRT